MQLAFNAKYSILLGISLLGIAAFSCKTTGNTQPISEVTTRRGSIGQTDDASQAARQLIAPGATPQLVSRQFGFTEGPTADKQGNVFFTDQPNNKIWKYGTDGKLSVFLDKAGRANGLYFDNKGNLLACADEQNQLWAISPEGKVTVLVTDYLGQHLNGPNDVWAAPGGGIYFTDPYYQRDYWKRQAPEIEGEKVYFLASPQSKPVVAAADLVKPNGLVGTPDGRYLYIADIGDNKTYRYTIAADGTLTGRQLFVAQGSDGMTIDSQGNIYLAGNGITVYDPAGTQLTHIPIQANWTANLCFGGQDRKTLFITASEAIYTLQMNVQGVQ